MAFNVWGTPLEDHPTRSNSPSRSPSRRRQRINRQTAPAKNTPLKTEHTILEVEQSPLETVVNKYPVRVFKVGF